MKLLPVFTLLCIQAVAHADDAAAFRKASSSVVCVFGKKSDGAFFSGTGMVTVDGIVTANHVIQSAAAVAVIFPARDSNGAVIGDLAHYGDFTHIKMCRVIASDPLHDLALLKMLTPEKVEAIALAATSASPGEQVFTIGASAGQAMWHFSSGHVRQVFTGTYSIKEVGEVRSRIIQTSLTVNHGDSGSPIIDKSGNVVGIISATDTTRNQVHMGIDVSEVRAFLFDVRVAAMREVLKQK
jgi:S1-C subfamily serine protease